MKEQLEDAIAEIGGEPLEGSGFESQVFEAEDIPADENQPAN